MDKKIIQVIVGIAIGLFFVGIAMMSSLFLTSLVEGNNMFSSENLIRVGLFYLIGFPIVFVLKELWDRWRRR